MDFFLGDFFWHGIFSEDFFCLGFYLTWVNQGFFCLGFFIVYIQTLDCCRVCRGSVTGTSKDEYEDSPIIWIIQWIKELRTRCIIK